jgi:hypothetical protein
MTYWRMEVHLQVKSALRVDEWRKKLNLLGNDTTFVNP